MDIGKHLWKDYKKHHLKVYIVDGHKVRNKLAVSYGLGGHERGYSFIPKGEIWLENNLNPKERKLILLHELYERKRMMKDKWNLLDAHNAANMAEYHARKNPSEINSKLRQILNA